MRERFRFLWLWVNPAEINICFGTRCVKMVEYVSGWTANCSIGILVEFILIEPLQATREQKTGD